MLIWVCFKTIFFIFILSKINCGKKFAKKMIHLQWNLFIKTESWKLIFIKLKSVYLSINLSTHLLTLVRIMTHLSQHEMIRFFRLYLVLLPDVFKWLYIYIYIYIHSHTHTHTHTYIVIHRHICFVLSELISVARHTSFS